MSLLLLLCCLLSLCCSILMVARSIFLSAMGVAHYAAFMQWTGMLGKIPTSMHVEAVLECFYAQLELSSDILNPAKNSADDRSRCFEISRARNVALSLLCTSIQSMIVRGRESDPKATMLKEATEDTAFKLMYRGVAPSMLPSLLADTVEHMFRTDLLILLQYFCMKLQVPDKVQFEEVLQWLRYPLCSVGESPLLLTLFFPSREGSTEDPLLRPWLDHIMPLTIRGAPLETEETRRHLQSGLYITHHDLQVGFRSRCCCSGLMGSTQVNVNPLEMGDIYKLAAERLGAFIYFEAAPIFQQYCQIRRMHGCSIIESVLFDCLQNSMAWPTVFGTEEELPHFWCGSPPANLYQRKRLILQPIRVIR